MIASVHRQRPVLRLDARRLFALWECDVTTAVKPGQVNEVCVVIKDAYYAISEKKAGKSCRMHVQHARRVHGTKNWIRPVLRLSRSASGFATQRGHPGRAEPGGRAGRSTPPTSSSMPSVKKKELGLEVTRLQPDRTPTQKVADRATRSSLAAAGRRRPEKVFAGRRKSTVAARARRRSSSWPSRGRTRSSGGPTSRSLYQRRHDDQARRQGRRRAPDDRSASASGSGTGRSSS